MIDTHARLGVDSAVGRRVQFRHGENVVLDLVVGKREFPNESLTDRVESLSTDFDLCELEELFWPSTLEQ